MATKGNMDYMKNGVALSPKTPSVGDKAKITYDGLLAKSGATHVFAHVGYGSDFDSANDINMAKTVTGFEAAFPISRPGTLSVCFKDCANNWDNNSGRNYTFDLV